MSFRVDKIRERIGSSSPMITSEPLMGSSNYLAWVSSIQLWCKVQGVQDHITNNASVANEKAKASEVDERAKAQWKKLHKETSICSSPDAEVYRGWEKDQTESSGDYLIEKIRDSLESEEGKRKSNKEKGMSTISRYFQSQQPDSLLKVEYASTSKLSESSSLSDHQSELPQENLPARGESSVDARLCSQIKLKRPAWSYDIDEIDQDVLNELPKQIQEEVQAWLRPQKRPNTVKRNLGITRYFLPAKDK